MARIVIAAALLLTACGAPVRQPAILLFDGRGTSPDDVAAIEAILNARGLGYATAGSFRLGLMSESELLRHRLLIVPGGNFESIGKHLTPAATAHIRRAVHDGMSYLGICAGAFFAGASPYNGLNLTSGVRFPFYGAEARGIRKAAVAITPAAGAPLDLYWEDGPELTGWGAVVAKYADGAPAIVEGAYGSGWLVLSGIHPEAPEHWRHGLTFATSVDASHAYAAALIEGALNRTPLPHF